MDAQGPQTYKAEQLPGYASYLGLCGHDGKRGEFLGLFGKVLKGTGHLVMDFLNLGGWSRLQNLHAMTQECIVVLWALSMQHLQCT